MATMLVTPKRMRKLAAHASEAKAGVEKVGRYREGLARHILNAAPGGAAPHSFISGEMGKTDFYIILNDTRGQNAALSIEYGRIGFNRDKNGRWVTPSRAVAPLRTATVGLM